MRRSLIFVIALVLLVRVPFLHQAIQGDDVYYLAGAEHAQIDPAHPGHARYVFLGDAVDMRGHPHPPLNAWILGGLLAIFGDVSEVPFHAAYAVFTLIAALAMWSLARRFVPDHALLATVLLVVTPAFVVNGNSLESDLPFLAFWMAGIALFISAVDYRSAARLFPAIVMLGLAALAAYQSVAVIPILWLYVWQHKRGWTAGWVTAITPAVVLLCWQAFERASTGALPAQVLAGYFQTYNLQSVTAKLKNAASLTVHLGWMVFPLLTVLALKSRSAWVAGVVAGALAAFLDPSPLFWACFGAGVVVIVWMMQHWRDFLAQWILVFFAAALVLFFAGSARYLLPLAAPLAMLVARSVPRREFAQVAVACQLCLSLGLAWTNYEHWDGYRRLVQNLSPELHHRRAWINGEWGLRFYAEAEGALPLNRGQALRPGDLLLSSELAYPIPYTTGGGQLVPYREQEIRTDLPFRLIGLNSRSGYSTASFGLRAFDLSSSPVDRVRVGIVVARRPTLEFLPMNAPEAEQQIVSGVFQLESGQWRWMGGRAALLLKRPAAPKPLRVEFYVPDTGATRTVTLTLDGKVIGHGVYEKAGTQTLVTQGSTSGNGESATLVITVDKTFSVPGDNRQLGVILSGAGFR